MADYDDLNTNRIFTIGIISIVVTAVTALAVQVVYYSLVQWHEADLAEKSSYRRQNKVIADQSDELTILGVDETTGNLTIPISKAMQLIAADNGSAGHDDAGHAKAGHGDEKHADHDDADHKDADHDKEDHKKDDHNKDDHKDSDDKEHKDDSDA